MECGFAKLNKAKNRFAAYDGIYSIIHSRVILVITLASSVIYLFLSFHLCLSFYSVINVTTVTRCPTVTVHFTFQSITNHHRRWSILDIMSGVRRLYTRARELQTNTRSFTSKPCSLIKRCSAGDASVQSKSFMGPLWVAIYRSSFFTAIASTASQFLDLAQCRDTRSVRERALVKETMLDSEMMNERTERCNCLLTRKPSIAF